MAVFGLGLRVWGFGFRGLEIWLLLLFKAYRV